MKNILTLLAVLLLAMSANAQEIVVQDLIYGNPFDAQETVEVITVLENPADYLDKEVAMSGTLTAVCQKAGCWVRMGDEDNDLFVKFGDHDFTIPMDTKGDVIVHGTLIEKETSVDELKHFAEDAGKSQEEIDQITEPEVEYWFVADGLQAIE